MLGAVIGDIVGSNFEFENNRSPFFMFWRPEAFFTDDTVIMAAVVDMLNSGAELSHDNISDHLRAWLLANMERCPGAIFLRWCYLNKNNPYNGTGNQALLRTIAVVKWCVKNNINLANTLSTVRDFVVVTHDSFDAIKASEVYATILYNLMTTKDLDDEKAKEIVEKVCADGKIEDTESTDALRIKVVHNLNSMFALKVLRVVIRESDDFTQAIRNTISLGGDSDGLAAIVGAVSELIWGCEDHPEKLNDYFKPQNQQILDLIKSLY